jgi:hypothetical protein
MLIQTEKESKAIYASTDNIYQARLFARNHGVKTRGKSYSEQWLFKQLRDRDVGKKSDWKDLPFVVVLVPGGKKLFTWPDQVANDPGTLIKPIRLDGLMTLAEAGYRWFNGNDANVRYYMSSKPSNEWFFEFHNIGGIQLVRHK